ncbi:MAG: DUF2993 domain-containing protein [Pseudonocardia sp.]|nr:DUF2993 domain-containing protein [Pseudonocardia sp.]
MKRIVLTLIVAVALLIAVDCAAAATAEYQVSTRMREQLALDQDPAVRVTGFPFLTQALAGDYRKVEVSAERVNVGVLHNLIIRAELYHVRMPAKDVLSGNVHGLTIDEAQGTVLVTKDDLIRELPGVAKLRIEPVDAGTLDQAKQYAENAAPGSSVSDIDPDSAVRLLGTTSVLGQRLNVSVIAVLRLIDGQIQITPKDIRVGTGGDATRLPRVVQSGLSSLFTVRLNPGALPFSITPTSLRAVDNALQVSGSARDIVIGEPANGKNAGP